MELVKVIWVWFYLKLILRGLMNSFRLSMVIVFGLNISVIIDVIMISYL